MTQSDTATPPGRSVAVQGQQLSPEVLEILVPSLQAGLGAGELKIFLATRLLPPPHHADPRITGTVGLVVGAASGIVRSAAPVLFSAVTGAQWFVLGSSYSGEYLT